MDGISTVLSTVSVSVIRSPGAVESIFNSVISSANAGEGKCWSTIPGFLSTSRLSVGPRLQGQRIVCSEAIVLLSFGHS